MSLVKSKAIQLGFDATPTNNFLIYQPLTPDGTFRIANGNQGATTDIMTVTSGGSVTFAGTTNFSSLNFGAGSESAPSLFPTGDSNTGIWFPAADTFAVSTGGTERIRVASGGNVGIGTNNPATKLHVAGDARLTGTAPVLTLLRTDSASPSARIRFVGSDNADKWELSSNYLVGGAGFEFNYAGSNTMFLSTGGFLGVGTSSPAGHVNAYTAQGGTSIISTHGVLGSYPKASAMMLGPTSVSYTISNNGSTATFTGSAGMVATNTAATNAPTDLLFITTSGGNPGERMRITSGGSVYIGGSTPNYGFTPKLWTNGIIATGDGYTNGNYGIHIAPNVAGQSMFALQVEENSLKFGAGGNPTSGWSELMRLTNAGILKLTNAGNIFDGTLFSTITLNNTASNTWSRIRFDRSGTARWGVSLGTDNTFKIGNFAVNDNTSTLNDNALCIDMKNNVGLGGTPSAWDSNYTAIQVYGGVNNPQFGGALAFRGNNSSPYAQAWLTSNAYRATDSVDDLIGWKAIRGHNVSAIVTGGGGGSIQRFLQGAWTATDSAVTWYQPLAITTNSVYKISSTDGNRRNQWIHSDKSYGTTSGAWVSICYVNHTCAANFNIMVVHPNGPQNGGGSACGFVVGTYGNTGAYITNANTLGGGYVTGISVRYNNSGYVMEISVTGSFGGVAPRVYWSVDGWSWDAMSEVA